MDFIYICIYNKSIQALEEELEGYWLRRSLPKIETIKEKTDTCD